MKRIEEQYESYRTKVIPKTASEVQINETRIAFYAGVASMFAILQKIGDTSITPEQGEKILEDISQELIDYGKRQRELAESRKIRDSIFRGTK